MAYKVKTSGAPSMVFRTYACDSAGTAAEHTFELMMKPEEHPSFCPVCGYSVDQRSRPRPSKVSIGGKGNLAKAVDMTYRALEESSADRAAALNNPNMKITDMKDRLREGDVAAVMPSNSVTQFMQAADAHNIRYGWGGGSMGTPAFHSATPTPLPPNQITGAGHEALWVIQGNQGRTHAATQALTTAKAQVNKPTGGG